MTSKVIDFAAEKSRRADETKDQASEEVQGAMQESTALLCEDARVIGAISLTVYDSESSGLRVGASVRGFSLSGGPNPDMVEKVLHQLANEVARWNGNDG